MLDALQRLEQSLENMVHLSPGQQRAQDAIEGPARHVCLPGGTRSGKTFLIVREIIKRAERFPGSLHAALRFRANACRQSLAMGTIPTVARRCFPHLTLTENRQYGFFELPNGSQFWYGGLDDDERVEKVLGNEYVTILLNEASQIAYSSAIVAMTRLAQVIPGCSQKLFVDLNPAERTHWTNRLFGEKRDPATRLLVENPEAYERVFLNPIDNEANLSPEYIATLKALPTRQRKRFYEGQYIEEIDGALWTLDLIEQRRIDRKDVPEDIARTVVALDPAISNGEGSAETGIIVMSVGAGAKNARRGYVLQDASGKYGPTEWAAKAIQLYRTHEADCIVAEINQGGAMVEATIRAIDSSVKFKGVHASRGKLTRAEPIAALFEQGRIVLAGSFPELEDQMISYVPGGTSPDRLDAMVWAATECVLDGQGAIAPITEEMLMLSSFPDRDTPVFFR